MTPGLHKYVRSNPSCSPRPGPAGCGRSRSATADAPGLGGATPLEVPVFPGLVPGAAVRRRGAIGKMVPEPRSRGRTGATESPQGCGGSARVPSRGPANPRVLAVRPERGSAAGTFPTE